MFFPDIKNHNIKIVYDAPVIFPTEQLANKSKMERALIAIGEAADSYLSVKKKYINASTLEAMPVKGHTLKTIVKITSYILTVGLLPLLALTPKRIYQAWTSDQMAALHFKPEKRPSVNSIIRELDAYSDDEEKILENQEEKQSLPAKNSEKLVENKPKEEMPAEIAPAAAEVKESAVKAKLRAEAKPKIEISEAELDILILANLQELKTENSPAKKLKLLFNLKKYAEINNRQPDTKIGGQILGELLKSIRYAPPQNIKNIIPKIGTGQFFVEEPPLKPTLPDAYFYDLATFVEMMIYDILKKHGKKLSRDPELREFKPLIIDYNIKFREEGKLHGKQDIVEVITDSGRRKKLVEITGHPHQPTRPVPDEKLGVRNPWNEEKMWVGPQKGFTELYNEEKRLKEELEEKYKRAIENPNDIELKDIKPKKKPEIAEKTKVEQAKEESESPTGTVNLTAAQPKIEEKEVDPSGTVKIEEKVAKPKKNKRKKIEEDQEPTGTVELH